MLKKTITCEDLNGNVVTETATFNLTQTQLAELEANTVGGLEAKLTKCIEDHDEATMFNFIKELILSSYGVISEDGKRFLKKKDGVALRDEFEESVVFDAIFTELSTNADSALAFLKGVFPKTLVEQAEKSGAFNIIEGGENA